MFKQNQWLKVFSPVVLSMFFATAALAASPADLDAAAAQTLKNFYTDNTMHQELAQKAAGVLIFPRIRKAGVGIGGEYGQGVLQVNGESVAYFKIGGASVGATLGVAGRSEVMLFMTPQALERFMNSHVWTVGVDADVAVVSKGAGGDYDTETLKKPILAFVFGEKGLIADVSLAGTKITRKPS
jgi:lipid-binding SYLF domain-containing protein